MPTLLRFKKIQQYLSDKKAANLAAFFFCRASYPKNASHFLSKRRNLC